LVTAFTSPTSKSMFYRLNAIKEQWVTIRSISGLYSHAQKSSE